MAKITFVTLFDANYSVIADTTVPHWREYCQQHGYNLEIHRQLLDSTLPAQWNKLPALQSAMNHLSHGDWAIWFDVDIAIHRPEIPISAHLPSKHLVWISSDSNGICTGFFAVKVCPWTKQLIDMWQFLGGVDAVRQKEFDVRPTKEQDSLKCLARYFPSVQERMQAIPDTLIGNPQTRPSDSCFAMHYWANGAAPEVLAQRIRRALEARFATRPD